MPRSPLYIVSKGRWETRHTMRALDAMQVPYWVVVEPQEADQYARVLLRRPVKDASLGPGLLVLPAAPPPGAGSIPARNFAWQHAVSLGADAHWCLDDNLRGFHVLQDNRIIPAKTGQIFDLAEAWCAQYRNIGLAGFQYSGLVKRRFPRPPFMLNTRIYSCLFLPHARLDRVLDEPWRGVYNEDTDLSLRVLKAGLVTVLFYMFLAKKLPSRAVRGGNTDTLYAVPDADVRFAESLRAQHPDVVRVGRRYGRTHHVVDYTRFTQALVRDPGAPPLAHTDTLARQHTPDGRRVRFDQRPADLVDGPGWY
jgi:hypothetical protein